MYDARVLLSSRYRLPAVTEIHHLYMHLFRAKEFVLKDVICKVSTKSDTW